jgi:hypothetical protein
MAGIKAPLLDILNRLSTLDVTNNDGNTVKLFTRIWNNQLEYERAGNLEAYPKPAAFVEILSPVVYQEIGKNLSSADLGFNIHLIHEYYNADGTFEQDLEVFDLRDKVVALLSQYKPTGCGLIFCTGESQDYEHDNLYHYIISFVCSFIDSKASPYDDGRGIYIEKEAPTDVEIHIQKANEPVFDFIQTPYKIPH